MQLAAILFVAIVGGLSLAGKRWLPWACVAGLAALVIHVLVPTSGVTQARYERVQFALVALLPGIALVTLAVHQFRASSASMAMRVLLFVVALLAASNLLHELGLGWFSPPADRRAKLVRMSLETAACALVMLSVRFAATRLVERGRV